MGSSILRTVRADLQSKAWGCNVSVDLIDFLYVRHARTANEYRRRTDANSVSVSADNANAKVVRASVSSITATFFTRGDISIGVEENKAKDNDLDGDRHYVGNKIRATARGGSPGTVSIADDVATTETAV